MAQRKNITEFSAVVNNKQYSFTCYTTNTRCGFCHTCVNDYLNVSDTKISYFNRTWERFTYESVLINAINKCPKADRKGLIDALIERKAKQDKDEADAMFNKFKTLHDGLSEKNKEHLKNVEIRNEDDAKAVMAVMSFMTLLQ